MLLQKRSSCRTLMVLKAKPGPQGWKSFRAVVLKGSLRGEAFCRSSSLLSEPPKRLFSPLLQLFEHFYFGEVQLDAVRLSQRFSTDASGYYATSGQLNFC